MGVGRARLWRYGLVSLLVLAGACKPEHRSAPTTSTSLGTPSASSDAVLATSTSTTASPPLPPRVGSVDFVDPERGWALLFKPCGTQTCWAIYASDDGGLSWLPRADLGGPLPSPSFSP